MRSANSRARHASRGHQAPSTVPPDCGAKEMRTGLANRRPPPSRAREYRIEESISMSFRSAPPRAYAARERAANESVRTLTLFVRIHGRIAVDNESVLASTIHPMDRRLNCLQISGGQV